MLFTTGQTNFRTIKEELLATLQSTHPSGQLNGQTIPSDADDIMFARANNAEDLRAGWTPLEIHTDDDHDYEDEAPPGKKRKVGDKNMLNFPQEIHTDVDHDYEDEAPPGKKRKVGDKNMLNCPQGTGLEDGSILAFRFRHEKAAEGGDGDGDGDEVWDVVIPTFDDETPSQVLAADASRSQR